MPGPASLSDEARDWLARNDPRLHRDGTQDVSLPEQRALLEADAAAIRANSLERHACTLRETTFDGIPCAIVTPANALTERRIFYVFGGGFTLGSPRQDMTIIAALAEYARAIVIAPTYRLAPEHPFPAGLKDVETALCAVLRDGDPCALAGESAGGNLALSSLLRLPSEQRAHIPALALMSPATDLSDNGDSFETARDPFLDPERVRDVTRLYAQDADLKDPAISPIHGAYDKSFPPTLITSGTRDLFLSHCTRLACVLRAAQVPCELRVWEGLWHVFEYYTDIPEADASLREFGAFLANHFPRAANRPT